MKKRMNLRHFPLIVLLILTISPILLLLINAVKPREEFNTNPFGFPSTVTMDNLIQAWNQGGYGQAFINSLIVGVSTVAIILVCGGLCAYALAKMKFKGANAILAVLLFISSIPMAMFLVPLFFLWQKLNLIDSLFGIIIIYSGIFMPMSIFLLRSYFIGIPTALLESARVDGCNELQVLIKIVVPIAKPAFITVALLVGLWSWNEFFFANAFLYSDELRTVATRYIVFTDNYSSNWSLISAAGMITTLPFMLLYFLLQRRFLEGMIEGSLK